MAAYFNIYQEQVRDIHEYLDKHAIPREDDGGIFTPMHRIKLLERKYLENLSEIENYYLRKKPHVD